MDALNSLFAVLFLLSFVVLLIGLIKPTWIKLKSRKMVTIVTIGAALIFMILFAVTQSDEQKAQIKASQEKAELERAAKDKVTEQEAEKPIETKAIEPTKEVKSVEVKNLGLSAEEFRTKFNQKLKQIDFEGIKSLSKLNIEEINGNKSFTADLTPSISMLGEVDDANNLKALLLVIGKHKDKNAALDYIALASIMTNVISPNDKDALPEALDLLETAVKAPNTGVHEKTVGNITYKIIPSDTIGLWFSIVPKE
jgi:hypothetical protein